MNFTYSENVKTVSNTNNNNNIYKLTNNENNIINKYKIDNETKFNNYMDNLLPEINYVHIDDIKTDNEGNEFKIKINNEEIFFSNNTFYMDNGKSEINVYEKYLYNYHINKKNIIIDTNKDDNNEEYERNIPFYRTTYKSNIYKNLLIYKTSSTIAINFSYIFNLLNISLPLLKIIYTKNYCLLIYSKPNYIIDVYYYYKKKIIDGELYILNNNFSNILNNKIYYNKLMKLLYIFKKLNVRFDINIKNFYYSKDNIFICGFYHNFDYIGTNNKTFVINSEQINLIPETAVNEYCNNIY